VHLINAQKDKILHYVLGEVHKVNSFYCVEERGYYLHNNKIKHTKSGL